MNNVILEKGEDKKRSTSAYKSENHIAMLVLALTYMRLSSHKRTSLLTTSEDSLNILTSGRK